MEEKEPRQDEPWEVSEYKPVKLPGFADVLLTWEAAALAIVVLAGLWQWAT